MSGIISDTEMSSPQSNRTIGTMSYSGKIILCLAVAFCVFQAIAARPHFDGNFIENVRFDLLKKCAGIEKDLDKEVMNVKHKLMKESAKLMKKAVKAGAPECVETARLQAEDQLEEKSQEIQDNVQELKDSIESGLSPEAALPEIMGFRSDLKNKLQQCKNAGKADLKAIQNGFSASGKSCLI